MRVLVLAVIAVLSPAPCRSQELAQPDKCLQKAITQLAINTCAGDAALRADSELNDVYRQLLSKAENEPGAIVKVRAAERAWIQYRDSYLEAMFPAKDKQASYGSEYPMSYAEVREGLTREHTRALRELIKQYDGEVH